MRIFQYRLLARLLLIGSVCLLTIAQTTRAFSSITLLDVPVVANHTQGFARTAVEEVGSKTVADAGVFTASSSCDAEEPKEAPPERLILYEVEAASQWPCERRFHRRIPPRSGDEDN